MHINRKIYKWSLMYFILGIYAWLIFYLFFRKIVITGKKNIPKNKPVIFAPNHQNALIDALSIIFTSMREVVFLARADIFKGRVVSAILGFIKILPIFRLRDGAEQLKNNDEIFDLSVRVLKENTPLCLFPETTHIGMRSLLPIKKGVPRIGFQAEEANNWQLDLHIVPVGIYYDEYNKFRGVLQVNYGKPIRMADFKDVYNESTPKGLNALRDRLADDIKQLAIDIRNPKYYQSYELYRNIYTDRAIKRLNMGTVNQANRFKADKLLIEKVEDYEKAHPLEAEKMHQEAATINQTIEHFKIHPRLLKKASFSLVSLFVQFIAMLIFSPVFLYGYINNLPVLALLRKILSKVNDQMFHGSFMYAFGLLVFPLAHLLQAAIVAIFVPHWSYAVAYLFSAPVSGFIAYKYYRVWQHLTQKFRMQSLLSEKNNEMIRTIELRKSIVEKLDKIVSPV